MLFVVAQTIQPRLIARVRRLRLAHKLTQKALAEKAGLGYKYYQHVEAGRRRDIRLSTLEKLAKACELELWKLVNLDAEMAAGGEDTQSKYVVSPDRQRRKG
ncbi:MAG: helix-turn-helix transcriptional regulator [Verrucomicrobia bacterium]|nr:helix-turn-helix transcriptional regulator [Verrucomicrobiota bacterium]